MARGGWHYMPASIQACSAIHRGLPWLMSSAKATRQRAREAWFTYGIGRNG